MIERSHLVGWSDGDPAALDSSIPELMRTGASVLPIVPTAISRAGDAAMARSGGNGGSSIMAPITIQTYGDSEQMGHKVQRHLQESRNWRTTDQSVNPA